ncbi:uncharacterized protein RMCC_4096 [Mycolicibacterium canariasense]|uniref:Uncharacterized protein n=1 Tax=Mycolicibacterium canariasense TaxID=228230 RepID=A0A117IAZ3_MYCCR|nr:hypothetical protein [Mycolicibacterium canariasense]MCV7211531.1 hypothetical protein [Mycolicibacterium canariasense]ORV08532.1 hypothetical protein AWB94_12405 [Mycolicibacterium canariasense]GAS97130.1 uncharacterized protein RMCC_4096 [Mycolicibacterium canariasense]
MSAVELLGQAQRILNDPRPDGLSSRMAAFLARQALELVVDQRCIEVGAPASWASMRSKLAVLRSLDTAEAADSAAIAWNRLSAACHVHAFELQPSAAEVTHLCKVVASLLPA